MVIDPPRRTRRRTLLATGGAVGAAAGCLGRDAARITESRLSTDRPATATAAATDRQQAPHAIVVDDRFDGNDVGARFNAALNRHPDARAFVVPPGRYQLRTPLDCTSNRGFDGGHLYLQGVELVGRTDGEPMIDCTGSRAMVLWGGRLTGADRSTPSVGVLQARDESARVASMHKLIATRITGAFETAAIYNYAAEECTYSSTWLSNGIGDTYVGTVDNRDSVGSAYVTIATGRQSNNGHHFNDAAWFACIGNDDESAAIVAQGVDSLNVDQAFIASNCRAGVLIEGTERFPGPTSITNTRFHAGPNEYIRDADRQYRPIDSAEMGMDASVRIDGPGGIGNLEIHNCVLQADGPVVSQASGTSIRGFGYTRNTYGSRPGIYDTDAPVLHHVENLEVRHDPITFGGDTTMALGTVAGPGVIYSTDVTWDAVGPDVWVNGVHAATQDLAGVEPSFAGERRRDDGSNFAPGEPAYADPANGVWRATSDPAEKTASYSGE
jgi:hypothetical protein